MDPVFERLRSIVATRTRRIVVWCGAGLSASAGIPTWKTLQRQLENALVAKLESLDLPESQKEAKVRSVRQERNPWIAFHRLESELGLSTFRAVIREALSKAVSVEVPPTYSALWRIRPAGLVNLNLDRLATRAISELESANLPIEFKGKEVGAYAYTLNNPRPFICNLHGVTEDVESWIFTQPSLRELASSDAYQSYLSAVLMTSTVIFVGLTVDDVAVGGHLERLQTQGLIGSNHFWLTDRRDVATDNWAERHNLQIIRYKPSSSNHPELVEMLEELAAYVQPEDDAPPPVVLDLGLIDSGIEPQFALVTKSPEEIRSALNAHAATILASGDESAYPEYESFSRDYDRAIHIAWYTSTEPADGENKFLGYLLLEEVARGAFGIVFKAIDREGNQVAIKVLHAEIRKQAELLKAFRRGARSMRIISEREVPGIVKYIGASEIPATLIMEWVEGPNLTTVVESGLNDWGIIIQIAQQLTTIIADAHALPERVLHRDIRPSNMIVCGYWDGDSIDLRVIDFDLSWHRGSIEKSVIFGSQLSGYLAPEQVQRTQGVSTQHAAVDSYGIGMTLFFMVAGRNPSPGEHAHGNWKSTLVELVNRPQGSDWRSLPARVARLIYFATRQKQADRWDVIQLRSELSRLQQAINGSRNVDSPELWAEEIFARSSILSGYTWNEDKFSAEYDFGTGLRADITGNESSKEILLRLVRVAGEADNRNKMGVAINRARSAVDSALAAGGWHTSCDIGQGVLSVEAVIDIERVKLNLDGAVSSLDRAVERMNFR